MSFDPTQMLTFEDMRNHPMLTLGSKSRYSCYRLVFPENVAEHTCNVALISLMLAKYFNFQEGKEVFDIRDVAYRAVAHDIGEAYTADVVISIKNSSPVMKRLINEYETKVMSEDKLLDKGFINEINDAKETRTLNGIIVHLADRVDALIKIYAEYTMQRTSTLHYLYLEVIYSQLQANYEVLKTGLLSPYTKILEWMVKFTDDLLGMLLDEKEAFHDFKFQLEVKTVIAAIFDELFKKNPLEQAMMKNFDFLDII